MWENRLAMRGKIATRYSKELLSCAVHDTSFRVDNDIIATKKLDRVSS